MISFIRGELAAVEEDKAVIDVGGRRIWGFHVRTGPQPSSTGWK